MARPALLGMLEQVLGIWEEFGRVDEPPKAVVVSVSILYRLSTFSLVLRRRPLIRHRPVAASLEGGVKPCEAMSMIASTPTKLPVACRRMWRVKQAVRSGSAIGNGGAAVQVWQCELQ